MALLPEDVRFDDVHKSFHWSIPISHLCLCVAVADMGFVICEMWNAFFLCWLHTFFWRTEGIFSQLKLVHTKYSARPQVFVDSYHLE